MPRFLSVVYSLKPVVLPVSPTVDDLINCLFELVFSIQFFYFQFLLFSKTFIYFCFLNSVHKITHEVMTEAQFSNFWDWRHLNFHPKSIYVIFIDFYCCFRLFMCFLIKWRQSQSSAVNH